jgi:predicted secreted Zn-dependent protease
MSTPAKVYIEVLNGVITPRWAPNREDKTDVEYVRGDLHEAVKAENDEMRDTAKLMLAEIDRLKWGMK